MMGFFSRLFKRGSKTPVSSDAKRSNRKDKDIAPELEPALEAMLASDYQKSIAQASEFINSKVPDIMVDANRLCALSYAHLDDYEQCFNHYLRLFSVEESAHTALQLATTSVMCNELLRGEAWFEKFNQLNATEQNVQPAEARTNFIAALTSNGYWSEAFPHVNWLKQGYQSYHCTDSHFFIYAGISIS